MFYFRPGHEEYPIYWREDITKVLENAVYWAKPNNGPKPTNALLDAPSKDELLFKKNKWLLCHEKNDNLIKIGVFPGIYGENYKIQY